MPVGVAHKGGILGAVDAIPDSENLHAHYDLQEQPESDGETIDPLIDQSGNGRDADAVGGPTMDADGYNGHAAGDLDGIDDGWLVSSTDWGTLEQPFTIYAVIDITDDPSGTHSIYRETEEASGTNRIAWTDTEWNIFANNGLDGSSDDGISVIAGVFDGTNSVIWEDGSNTNTGDAGGRNLNAFPIGHRDDNSEWFEGLMAEIAVYDTAHDSDTRSDFWSYAQSRWSI